jgi:hypothetical protein
MRMAGDLDAEEQELEEEDYEDQAEDPDNADGWIDEREEMAEEDVDNLEDEVEPIRFLLTKVSEYATVCCTVLANPSPHFVFFDDRFANLHLPSKTPARSPFPSGTRSSKTSHSTRGSFLVTSVRAGMPPMTCFPKPTILRQLSTRSLTCAT